MIIFNVFVALLWAVVAGGCFIGGLIITYSYAMAADKADLPVLQALGGVTARMLGTIVAVSLVVGVPLLLIGM